MQRLFSMFPTGPPGIALVLLRITLGVMVLEGMPGRLASQGSAWVHLPLWAVVIALCVGFLTPLAALLCVAFEAAMWCCVGEAQASTHGCMMLIGVAVAMLGPGAYSLDARLFGRRQVIISPSSPT